MRNRGFILDAAEVQKNENCEVKKGDVFTLFHLEKQNRFFLIKQLIKRENKVILLTTQINSLTMVGQQQNFGAHEFVMRDLGKGKCEVITLDCSTEDFG